MRNGNKSLSRRVAMRHFQRTAYVDGPSDQLRDHLLNILAILRAQYLSYQHSHWQSGGRSAYGDHLLFQRLYESVTAQVDELAEKVAGYLGSSCLSPTAQVELISKWVSSWEAAAECHHRRGIKSEEDVQAALKLAYEAIEAEGSMSLGLDDWLMATASAHETNTYLLQQVLDAAPGMDPEPVAQAVPVQIAAPPVQMAPPPPVQMAPAPVVVTDSPSPLMLGPGSIGTPFAQYSNVKSADAVPVAPTAEGMFWHNPEKYEVRQLAETKAITNDVAVAVADSEERGLTRKETREEVAKTVESPPTPAEIVEEPGGSEFSTLNRYVVKTDQPTPDLPEGKEVERKMVPEPKELGKADPEARVAALRRAWFSHGG